MIKTDTDIAAILKNRTGVQLKDKIRTLKKNENQRLQSIQGTCV